MGFPPVPKKFKNVLLGIFQTKPNDGAIMFISKSKKAKSTLGSESFQEAARMELISPHDGSKKELHEIFHSG